MGPQVVEIEKRLAEFAGVKHCISCANGTDALMMVLRAWNIGPGDAVFVPAFTFAASAEVVALGGAEPVFVDVLPRVPRPVGLARFGATSPGSTYPAAFGSRTQAMAPSRRLRRIISAVA